ncbi:unnamed protein product, partial [Ectocarpus sp. 13 AM-2016]
RRCSQCTHHYYSLHSIGPPLKPKSAKTSATNEPITVFSAWSRDFFPKRVVFANLSPALGAPKRSSIDTLAKPTAIPIHIQGRYQNTALTDLACTASGFPHLIPHSQHEVLCYSTSAAAADAATTIAATTTTSTTLKYATAMR